MEKAKVFNASNTTTVWIQSVEINEDEDGRILFWSPYEDPECPGNSPGYENNQQGVREGSVLTLRYADGTVEQVVVCAQPQSHLGNKGRTQFQIKKL